MEIEFDGAKDKANIAKHGISLSAASEFEMAGAMVSVDDRADYGEDRFIAVGQLGGRLHVLIFTVRDGRIRAISLRKANTREVRRHGH
jgi:uncharacterized DUF497 family protein